MFVKEKELSTFSRSQRTFFNRHLLADAVLKITFSCQ